MGESCLVVLDKMRPLGESRLVILVWVRPIGKGCLVRLSWVSGPFRHSKICLGQVVLVVSLQTSDGMMERSV